MGKLKHVAFNVATVLTVIAIAAGIVSIGQLLLWHLGPVDPVEAAK